MIDEETVELLSNDELDSILASWDIDILSKEEKEDNRVQCPFCEKVCVSQRGLTRHTRCKHPETLPTTTLAKKRTVEDVMPFSTFKKCINQVLEQLGNDQCYPDEIRNQMKELKASLTLDDQTVSLYQLVAEVVLKFKGDAENFYPDFTYLFQNDKVIDELDSRCNVLIGFELANNVLASLVSSKLMDDSIVDCQQSSDFSPKDVEIITYLSGYVVGTLYRRIRFSKRVKTMVDQHYLSILMGCKYVEGTETDTSHHRLINERDKGGLWRLRYDCINIFKSCESYFLSATKNFVSKIDCKHLVSKLLEDVFVLACFGDMRQSADQKVSKEVSLNLLEDMLTLYIRVRSHSYAKDKQQHHEIDKSTNKSRSLRTEIKKNSSDLDKGH